MSDSSTNPRFEPVRSADEISRYSDRGRGNAAHAAGSGPMFRERSQDPSATMARNAFPTGFLFRDTMLKVIHSDNIEYGELTKAA
jgi:hypothetical protein